MVTPDDDPGREPVDPVFAALFRPEELDPVEAESRPERPDPPVDPAPAEAEPMAEHAATPTSADVDTGRLFRSQGVVGDDVAVLALNSDRGGRLRTLARDQVGPSPAPVTAESDSMTPIGALIAADAGALEEAPVQTSRRDRRRETSREFGHRASGIAAGAVYLIIIGLTVVVAFVNAWLGGGELGWPTGLALLVSSVYCALRVRRDDDIVAFITPPIAFFVAAITAGQAFRGASGGGILNRAQLVFFTMAYNWYWVIGATVVALVIVLVRRRR